MKTITTTHPAALGFLAALFSFTLLAPSAAGQENVKATCFTIESNKAQSILLDTTTLEAVDLPVYTGKGNCEIHKATDSTQTVWSQQEFSFLEKPYEGNYTVHPSLWNNGRNNHLNGVFRVHDDMPIFQVRGYDMANITFVYTGSGWLIFDTLMSGECTEAAVALFNDYLTTIVDEDGKPYKEVNEYNGIGFDRTFYKYQYCETLYECYKYLTGNYVPDSKTQFVKFCIDMTEPYANRFRRKPGEVPTGSMGADFYPFDKDDRYAWDTYCKPIFKDTVTDSDVRDIYLENIKFWQAGASQPANSGIGEDGLFFGSELLHFLYRSYRFLYINNSN